MNVEAVSFTCMADGTREDYELLERLEAPYIAALADRLLRAVEQLEHSFSGYQVRASRAGLASKRQCASVRIRTKTRSRGNVFTANRPL
jgi:hypothetical protein